MFLTRGQEMIFVFYKNNLYTPYLLTYIIQSIWSKELIQIVLVVYFCSKLFVHDGGASLTHNPPPPPLGLGSAMAEIQHILASQYFYQKLKYTESCLILWTRSSYKLFFVLSIT